ncbi:MAG: DUF1844 domain-containing protein [Polyangiaceae bacterium]|nr:DUF1844 domain-containing protein [Polyangiaceae bacterium]
MSSPGDELPQLDFSTFILGIIGTTYVHLGDAPSPDGAEPDFELAQQNIELLILLQKKTKGNLTGDEERLLDQALIDLRSRYAEVTRS